MGKSFYSLIVLTLIWPALLIGQTDLKIKKGEFRHGKAGFEEAWKHIRKGNSFFREKGPGYAAAYEEFRKACSYNDSSAALNCKTGTAALFSGRKDEASYFLLKSVKTNPKVADDAFLLTGIALQYAGKYSEAAGPLTSYLESDVKKTDAEISAAKKHLEECVSALDLVRDSANFELVNTGPGINSASDDYSEVFSPDRSTIFFTSRRNISDSSGQKFPGKKNDENIFTSAKRNGIWDQAVTAGKKLTTEFNEAPLYINDSLDSLYVYEGYKRGGDIYVSHKKNGNWSKPSKLPFRINSAGAETSFTISPSGNEIFFVSEGRKNGTGGKDIFFIRKTGHGKWSEPVNPGPSVNTTFDEESVRLSARGDTLWFSSKGHNNIGGFDIFYSVRDSSGGWLPAVNAGYPLNTQWDELFFYPPVADGGQFFFVSNRKGGSGGYDIYSGRKKKPAEVPQTDREIILKEPPGAAEPDTLIIK
jgi:hypothetical protein